MQDRESQSDVNPGIVEQGLDEAGVEREGLQGDGGLRGGPITERERPDGGQITQREAFDERGQAGREGMMHGSRSGGTENTTDRSDPMPPAGGSTH
ncbi:hypothetical protein [Longimicrobium sp.]|uniref:hypothetical protein n=1 Tax=Longimicrobium sp. TaxID=2029185 RepID=UPI002E35C67B|nr:hypothetical protein [Longimicrobium sp.]HEX6040351.1 hypothetical protein [Longimicrobium sp.]